jgi:NAD(P)-dependent dehydrogenase (short-subunit alcohol dehydrogenase family)
MRIADKRWLVTGRGSGMGRSLILAILVRGARVVTVDINQQLPGVYWTHLLGPLRSFLRTRRQ